MSFEVGDSFGDYQVLGVLGRGGMGKVYKVRNVISNRVEAAKILLPNLADNAELAERFLREIRVHASLDHPNIAGLHTALREGNQLLMIMEYVEGASIEAALKKGRIPLRDGAGYVCQVLSALSYAHARGVVHRDVKPANMMLTAGGTVKLMDFGIARILADRGLTRTGLTVGSVYYMSPEQIKGAAELDGRSDLYSLGIALYEIVTGKRPFEQGSEHSIMSAHLQETPVPPLELDSKLPPALSEVILMAINKDPAQRFQSADAFRNALENAALGERQPAVAAPPPPPKPAAAETVPLHPPRKRRLLYMVAGSLATLFVLILAATQIPKWLKTEAVETPGSPPPIVLDEPEEEVSFEPESPAEPPTPSPAVQTQAQEPAAPPTRPPEPIADTSPPPATEPTLQEAAAAPSQPPPPVTSSAPTSSVPPPAAAPPAQAEETPPSPAPDQNRNAALRKARERMMLMASRISAVKSSLENLRANQRRTGVGLRGDIASSETRMEFYMDEAEAAIGEGDPEVAEKQLSAAERELEKLERFFGR